MILETTRISFSYIPQTILSLLIKARQKWKSLSKRTSSEDNLANRRLILMEVCSRNALCTLNLGKSGSMKRDYVSAYEYLFC